MAMENKSNLKTEIECRMEDVTDIYLTPLIESQYVCPFRLHYKQNGVHKSWDLLAVHDSVAVLLFNVTRRKVIFVKQFRPAVYYNSIPPEERQQIDVQKYPPSLGCTLEMCAGIVDKAMGLEQIACEEVLEECGYKVTPKDLHRIMTYRSGVGVIGSEQTMYYCEVSDDMQAHQGGGIDDEIISVVEMSIPETEAFLNTSSAPTAPLPCPPSALFALMWFLHHKAARWRKSFERYCGECKGRANALGPPLSPLPPILREGELALECPNPFAPPTDVNFTSDPRWDLQADTSTATGIIYQKTQVTLIRRAATGESDPEADNDSPKGEKGAEPADHAADGYENQ